MLNGLKAVLVGLVLGLLGQSSLAGQLEDGLAAYKTGDYAVAFRLYLPLAEQGNAVAQSSLGNLYSSGLGVPQDYVEAAKWFERAAESGNELGQLSLGRVYCIGKGVLVNEVKAVKWLTLSAEQGNNWAKLELGNLYERGCDITLAEVLDSAGISAKNLPIRLSPDKQRDKIQAHLWFNLAAAGFSTSDIKNRDEAVKNRDRIAADMTDEEIARAQSLATKWNAGHPQQMPDTSPGLSGVY